MEFRYVDYIASSSGSTLVHPNGFFLSLTKHTPTMLSPVLLPKRYFSVFPLPASYFRNLYRNIIAVCFPSFSMEGVL